LVLILAGLACLLVGFLRLSGAFGGVFPFLACAGALLPAGFALVLGALGHTLWDGRPLPLPARFVALGFAAIVVTAFVGAMFTLLLSGLFPLDVAVDWQAEALPIHVAAGLGGWLTLTAIGVSYRLLPMFMLSPDGERAT